MTTNSLAGKTAIITGSSRNIGRESAKALAADGANIVINGLNDKAAANAVAEEINDLGAKAIVYMCDAATKEGSDGLVDVAVQAFGGVDIAVVNASTRGAQPFLEMSHDDFRQVLDTTVDGAFFLCQAAIPHMLKAGWGRVITLSGFSWHIGMTNRIHNLTGKAGLTGFTRGIATEFATQGITANAISPALIETDRPASAGPAPDPKKFNIPMNRLGKMEEIAGAVRYLCQPEAGYMTGQVMHLNGGAYLGT